MNIRLTTPSGLSFRRTVMSHGWSSLLPFEFDEGSWTLRRVFDSGEGKHVTASLTETDGAIAVNIARGRFGKREALRIERDVRHIFRLDDDMTEFYRAVADDKHFGWIARAGAGRLLRSPTVFEDLVKTICTTNCSWALTKKMVTGLVNNLGRETADGRHAFPTPAAMALAPLSFYSDEMRAGYRAPYFKELAERVAGGELEVESWLTSELPTAELARQMKRVKGVGDYAAENLLKLVGRYDVLALDSWVRGTYARLYNRGRACADEKIARHYARFKAWRGLALWCDMTKDWMDEEDFKAEI